MKRQDKLLAGNVPPSAQDAEEVVLGAILIEKNSFDRVLFLRPEMFYCPAHQKIFDAIVYLNKADHYCPLKKLSFN